MSYFTADNLETAHEIISRYPRKKSALIPLLHLAQEQEGWVTDDAMRQIAELTDSVPWKWWAKYQKLDEQNARVEVVDLFHFLISLAQVLGMSADDVFEAYMKKNEVNFQRQDSGYTEKNENDSKHI